MLLETVSNVLLILMYMPSMALDLQSSQFITEVNLFARTAHQLSPTTSTFLHNLSKIGQQSHNASSLRPPLDVSPLGPMVSDRLRFLKRFLTCYFCIISCSSFLWALSLRHKPKRQQLRAGWALHPHLCLLSLSHFSPLAGSSHFSSLLQPQPRMLK